MTAQQLKNSILQMAVQGKLVPQDPTDEPASVLLERIRAEKEKLIKEGKIKKEKNPSYIFRGADNTPYEKIGNAEPVSIADEVPFDIPDSWEWVRLNDIVIKEIKRGKSPTYISYSNTLVFAQKCNVKSGGIDMALAKYLDEKTLGKYSSEEFMQDNDIVVNSTGTGTMGRIGHFHSSDNPEGFPIVPDSHVTVVRLNNEISCDYIVCCLQYYQKFLEEHGEGSTNQKELKPDTIKNLFIPLPPKTEQLKITETILRLEPFLFNYNSIDSQLSTLNKEFPDSLKKSILQMAVQGKLVPQDENDEPASMLLERIRAEKQKLIAEGKIKKDKNESVIFRRDNSHYEKFGNTERCIDDEIPFEVPDSWGWVRISSISSVVTKGTTPRGGNVAYLDEGIGFLRAENVAGLDIIDKSNLSYIDEETHNGYLKRSILKENDILITIAGTLGRTGLVRDDDLPLNANQAVSIVRLIDINEVNLLYLIYALNSPIIQKALTTQKKITAIPNLTLEIISNCIIPMPPLSEQIRIVEAIKTIIPYCESL